MKKKLKVALKFVAMLLILSGCIFIFSKPIKNYFVEKTSQSYAITGTTKKELEKNNKEEKQKSSKEQKDKFDFDLVKPVTTGAVVNSQLKGEAEALPMIASIAIPSVSIRLPIFYGLSNEGLLYGAGTMTQNQEMGEGNYSLASHRSDHPDLLFTPLERMMTGDKIYLTDLNNVYTYVTTFIEKVPPEQTEVIDPIAGKKLVTLVTCGDLYATTRVVVQGELIEKKSINKIDKEAAEAFKLPVKSY